MKPSLFAAFLLLTACQGDPLEDSEDIAGWANAASALGVFVYAYEPLAISDDAFEPADPACPTVTRDGDGVTIDGGGCVDSEGALWNGRAVVSAGEPRAVTLESYDHARDPGLSKETSGSFEITELGPDFHEYAVELAVRGGVDSDVEYTGTVDGTYGNGRTVWNGSGTVSRDALIFNSGAVTAETVDQVRDNSICPGEGISGHTTLESPDHVVVVTYDGATDCDDNDAARWSLDGEDQGTVDGVSCSSGGRGGGGLLVLLALAGFVRTSRRSRAPRRAGRTPPGHRRRCAPR